MTVYIELKPTFTFLLHVFLLFFFFFFYFFSPQLLTLSIVNSAYVYCLRSHKLHFLAIFFIKNRSHNIIYTFKNYFATVFSVSVFSFSENNLNPNTPKEDGLFTCCYVGCFKVISFSVGGSQGGNYFKKN